MLSTSTCCLQVQHSEVITMLELGDDPKMVVKTMKERCERYYKMMKGMQESLPTGDPERGALKQKQTSYARKPWRKCRA